MSSKLLKQQLHSVIRQRIDKQEGSSGKGKQQGKRAGKRAKKQAPPPEEQQAQTLAANLKYFARTTAARGPAADLVAEVGRRRRRCPLPPQAAATIVPARSAIMALPMHTGNRQGEIARIASTLIPTGARQEGLPAAAHAGGTAALQSSAGRRRGGVGG